MKVLWVCNTLPRTAARAAGLDYGNKEGWLDGMLDRLVEYCDGDEEQGEELGLALVYPVAGGRDKEPIWAENVSLTKAPSMSIVLYGLHEDILHPEIYNPDIEKETEAIIEDFGPDIIHVFGTEYGHALAVGRTVSRFRAKGRSIRLLIGLQGIISECAKVYTEGLPEDVISSRTLRDRIRDDTVARQREKFRIRGGYELEAITYATDITGRTDYDREWSRAHNPDAEYHHMNETLRREFYEGTWDATECDRHVILVSQGDYPLKGLHNILNILPDIAKLYPDVRLIVTGIDVTDTSSLYKRLKISGYGRYLNRLIKRNRLEGKVVFKGMLSADRMREELLSCNTYLCASSLENSPNSMGEAMLLGVPVIAHRTGGIPSLLESGSEGLLYDDTDEIPDMLKAVWDDDGYATWLGAAAMNRARATHDADKNIRRLLEIYERIC